MSPRQIIRSIRHVAAVQSDRVSITLVDQDGERYDVTGAKWVTGNVQTIGIKRIERECNG